MLLCRLKEGESEKPRKAFTFKNFGEEIASTDYSIVYQIAGNAISQVGLALLYLRPRLVIQPPKSPVLFLLKEHYLQ
jgi:hypothetical protein